MKKLATITILLVLLLVGNVWGQNFTLFNSENSQLPYNAVYSIYEDSDGNIWFGGQRDAVGIATVSTIAPDLSTWTIWDPADLGMDIVGDRAYYITEGNDGTMWFCTHYGVSCRRPDGTVETFWVDEYTRSIFRDSNGTIYASNRDAGGIYVSADNGSNWELWGMDKLGMTSGRPEIYGLEETADGKLWICTWYGVFYIDTEGVGHAIPEVEGYWTYAMTKDENDNLWVPDNDTHDLYKITTDGQVTVYDSTVAEVLKYPINDLKSDMGGNLILATSGAGLVVLNTTNWEYTAYTNASTAGAVPQDTLTHLIIAENGIWASTADQGILHVTNLTPNISDGTTRLTENYELSDNYPNPFNPVTTFSYTLPGSAEVFVGVYNLAGQLVKELDKGFKSQGVYQLQWDGTNQAGQGMASGIYIYQLRAGGMTISKKMVLVK
ncbi:MAG: hypothetical protein Kow00108_01710 [Calditrichia bacterium]